MAFPFHVCFGRASIVFDLSSPRRVTAFNIWKRDQKERWRSLLFSIFFRLMKKKNRMAGQVDDWLVMCITLVPAGPKSLYQSSVDRAVSVHRSIQLETFDQPKSAGSIDSLLFIQFRIKREREHCVCSTIVEFGFGGWQLRYTLFNTVHSQRERPKSKRIERK